MNLLDWLLVLLVLAYAVSGYWQGFVTGAFATAGLLLGGLFGVWLAPTVLGDADPSVLVSLGALFIVILSASLGQALLQFLGTRIRDRITWRPARAVDAVGGAVLSAVAVLIVAWALGVAVSGTRIDGFTPLVRESTILGQVDESLPVESANVLRTFNDVVGTTFFPRYLEPFAPERIVKVAPGPSGLRDEPSILAARPSVLKVRATNSCGHGVEGSGFLFSDNRLMTNAHVVAGVRKPEVIVGDSAVTATVVYYDPHLDIAVLALDSAGLPHLEFDTTAEAKDPVAILGFPQDGPYDVEAARIRSQQRLRSPDIYGQGTVLRQVFSLRGLVRPGNSGGPVVSESGDVVGMVFAASVTDPDTGYALTAEQLGRSAALGLQRTTPVPTGDCVG